MPVVPVAFLGGIRVAAAAPATIAVPATMAVRATIRAVRPLVATATATAVPVSPARLESTVQRSSSLVARVPWLGRLTPRPTPVHRGTVQHDTACLAPQVPLQSATPRPPQLQVGAPRAPTSRRTQPTRKSQRQAHAHLCATPVSTVPWLTPVCPSRLAAPSAGRALSVRGQTATWFRSARRTAMPTTVSAERMRHPRRRRVAGDRLDCQSASKSPRRAPTSAHLTTAASRWVRGCLQRLSSAGSLRTKAAASPSSCLTRARAAPTSPQSRIARSPSLLRQRTPH